MATINRDSRFSMTFVPASAASAQLDCASKESRISHRKRLERQLVQLWKMLTRSRTKQRASFVPKGFVSLTARRRNTLSSQFHGHGRVAPPQRGLEAQGS